MCFSLAARAGVVVSDPFTDGSRTNTTGGDALGLVYYSGVTTAGVLVVTNDNAGLGSGNALRFAPTSSFGRFVTYFGPLQLTQPGDTLTLQFDIRFAALPPTNLSWTLRLGLYNSFLTRTTADGNNSPRYDDVGYGCVVNSPGLAGNNLAVFAENIGTNDDILGGSTPGAIVTSGASGVSPAWSTNKQTVLLQLSRSGASDLTVQAQINAGTAAATAFAATNILTWTFDELGIGLGNTNNLPFLVDNLLVSTTAYGDSFDSLRHKWFDYLTGGTNLNLADATILSSIRTITNNATNWWSKMDKSPARTYLWSDAASTANSSHLTTCYNRLLAMALGYAVIGSSLKGNTNLAADIIGGLDWMDANRYNPSKAEYDNWWDWEIGAPLALDDTCTLMFDQLSSAELNACMSAVDNFTPTPDMTAANLIWKARVVGVRAALVKDAAGLTATRDAFSQVFPYVTNLDGFYTDGSFLQHNHHPYTGGYGTALLSTLSPLLPWLSGSPWQVVDPAQTNVVNWVFNSYEPLIYRGATMDLVRGREISRTAAGDHSNGHSLLQSILRIADFAPTNEAVRMRRLVKYHAQVDSSRNFVASCPLSLMPAAAALMADTNIAPRAELTGSFPFPEMDRFVHLRPGFGFALSTFSSRIYDYESINGENLHAWFTGSGMTYLYNADLTHYGDSFWATVDPYRLPGTTTPNTIRADRYGQSQTNAFNWVGGVSLDNGYGVIGMELGTYGSTLTARKSWFCFDDEIVCLGAGITSGDAAPIETTIENRLITTAGTNAFTVNGTNQSTALGWSNSLAGVTWAHLVGDVPGSDIGYYFPQAAGVQGLREARTNSWFAINTNYSASPITRNYLTLWSAHGIKPTNSIYAYAVLPNKSAAEVSAYAAAPDFTVLENSPQAQAVRENKLGLLAVNFWNAAGKTVDFVTCNNKASVLCRETLDDLVVAASDPTQTNSGSVSLTLNRSAVALISADAGITVSQLSPTIQMTIAMAGRSGATATARFSYYTNAAPVLSPVTNRIVVAGATMAVTNAAVDPAPAPQQLYYSLSAAPAGASINLTNGRIIWRPAMALAGTSNRFIVVVSEAGWWTNLPPAADAYVSDGSFAGNNYGTDLNLAVKQTGTSGLNRESYLKFFLPALHGSVSDARLQLWPSSASLPGTQALALVTNTIWSELGITWSNRPDPGSVLATWTPQAGQTVSLPVTSAALAAQAGGQTLAFKVYGTTITGDGLVNYAARESSGIPPALLITTTNGSLLQATQSFWVTVTIPTAPTIEGYGLTNDAWFMTINGASGPDYVIEASTNLVRWTDLFSNAAPMLPFVWTDLETKLSQRYYRVRLAP